MFRSLIAEVKSITNHNMHANYVDMTTGLAICCWNITISNLVDQVKQHNMWQSFYKLQFE